MNLDLLHYREWQGRFRWSGLSVWPIARTALAALFRRRLFWILYAISLLTFFMFFFGNFLLDWAQSYVATQPIRLGNVQVAPERAMESIRNGLTVLNGSNSTYAYFFLYQGLMVMVVLAMSGAVLIGNDFAHRSLPFYLAKPITSWHYLLGKSLAVAVVVGMLTTLPALVLFAQHGFSDLRYFTDPDFFLPPPTVSMMAAQHDSPSGLRLLLGILGYGMVLAVCLSIVLVSAASWMRRTMPLIMLWSTLFLFLPLLADILVRALQYDARFQLIDLWNNMSLLGLSALGISHERMERILRKPQPEVWEAALVLLGVCLVCLISLHRRTRAVEVIR